MLARLALYSTLGYVLFALEQSWDSWGFWCVLGLFWAAEHLTRSETVDELTEPLKAAVQKLEAERRRLGHTTQTQDTD